MRGNQWLVHHTKTSWINSWCYNIWVIIIIIIIHCDDSEDYYFKKLREKVFFLFYFLIYCASVVLLHPRKSRIIDHVLHVPHWWNSKNFLLLDGHRRKFLPGLGLNIEIHIRCILILVGTIRKFPLRMVGRVLSMIGTVL